VYDYAGPFRAQRCRYIISMGGDADNWVYSDPILKKLFKQIAQTRWLSQERQAEEIIILVNVAASNDLVQHVMKYVGGVDSQSWKEISNLANTCSYLHLQSLSKWEIWRGIRSLGEDSCVTYQPPFSLCYENSCWLISHPY